MIILKTVVITGITGKSGQYLLKRLLSESEKLSSYCFKLLCRKHGDYSKNTAGYSLVTEAIKSGNLNIELCEVDLNNEDEVESVFCEPVYMLMHIASVKMTMNIVPIALKYGVDNIIMVHTTGIYSKYKAAGEEYRQIEAQILALVNNYRDLGREINVTILRPTMIYGDLNDGNIAIFIKMVDKLRVFPVVNGARYDLQPVWCKDLGDAYYEVMLRWEFTKNKEYILSGGAPIQLREMFQEMAKQLGVKNIFISCPYPIAYMMAYLIYILSIKKLDIREKVQRLVEPRAYGHEMATKDFNYSPAIFRDGVRYEIEMYKKTKKYK